MTGEIQGLTREDFNCFCAAAMCEAGLRSRIGNEPIGLPFFCCKCKAIDATEIICAIEAFYPVEFDQIDHDKLCDLTKRGHIKVGEMAEWLGGCYDRMCGDTEGQMTLKEDAQCNG